VLSSYGGKCCISGVTDARLLIASHIVPWRDDKKNRLNPRNGLCLSAIHDKAFDSYLFTLSSDNRVMLSERLKKKKDRFLQEVFWPVNEMPIHLTDKFKPDPLFTEQHREKTFMLEAG